MYRFHFMTLLFAIVVSNCANADADEGLSAALDRAGTNRAEIEKALHDVPGGQKAGMEFLIRYMPERDLTSLSSEFLLENVSVAYEAWNQTPWKNKVPESIFLNDVLPYANINEQRDNWRADFFKQFKHLVKDAKSPGEAAAILNNKVFQLTNVKYSRRRKKPDQSPKESIESGLASCTGLSVLLIDACRAVGVPARFAGTPLWSDRSGNHSWVEIWDEGWHFTGACEPSGNELDKGWFINRASQAVRDDPKHSIYAVSYRHTPISFPLVWDRRTKYIYAVNVTDRYVALTEKLPEGVVRVMVRTLKNAGQERVSTAIQIKDENQKTVFTGKTNDESFDGNDHLSIPLKLGKHYEIQIECKGQTMTNKIEVDKPNKLITVRLKDKAAS